MNRTAVSRSDSINEGIVSRSGGDWYRIPDADRLKPFLMSVVAASDLWIYLSSRGGLTCGRRDEDGALFPYVTDDQLHEAHADTGPLTVLRIGDDVWRPFDWHTQAKHIRRNLYKSVAGNEVDFEVIDDQRGLIVTQRWTAAEELGVIRTMRIDNCSDRAVSIDILDGVRNLMPGGAARSMQEFASCLVNAYTRADVDPDTNLAAIALSAQLTDKPIPVEVLEATTLWSAGLPGAKVLLSCDQLDSFCDGKPLAAESALTGRRAAYLLNATVTLAANATQSWHVLADVRRTHADVERLRERLAKPASVIEWIERSVASETASLLRLVASADGLQSSADHTATTHHYANVLFNIMRGGVFVRNNTLSFADFRRFVSASDRRVAERCAGALDLADPSAPSDKAALLQWASDQKSPDLVRLAHEYLPLTFSRRHGDPSRPWNHFSIRVKNPDGTQAVAYQGNWRDIFQNWEALLVSFPEFAESVIAKFVNASTRDGFNPYRVTSDGIDWETAAPDDLWSNIGYWGDHQIVYLTRLLELSARINPGRLEAMLHQRCFSYADVPFRLKPYTSLAANSRETIVFDTPHQRVVEERVRAVGNDGKLVGDANGVLHVTLAEKLLVPILSKLSNLVPDAGIWMNTQRPEWNDANNALVGPGVSMVTACQLRRHLVFCRQLFQRAGGATIALSSRVGAWLDQLREALADERRLLDRPAIAPTDLRRVVDRLGTIFSDYRVAMYADGIGQPSACPTQSVHDLFDAAIAFLDHTIDANRRSDGLYHSYNLLNLDTPDEARVSRLYEMLEGQVAVLSSGALSSEQAVSVLDALSRSAIHRADQQSFMLYPARQRHSFFAKNVLPAGAIERAPLLGELIEARDTQLVVRDAAGKTRFASVVVSPQVLRQTLDRIEADPRWRDAVRRDRPAILSAFDETFEVSQFTGRSGTMFGYEGIGSIYWHMVTKLLLATQEAFFASHDADPSSHATRRLAKHYFTIRDGLGYRKSAKEYGAFPADPYSHTPAHAGAQQPGMTGQVKEEILTRWGELGVTFAGESLQFRPRLLQASEFHPEPTTWRYIDLTGETRSLELPAHSLAFTLQGQPVVYRLTPARTENRFPSREFRQRAAPREPLMVSVSTADLVG